MFAVASSGAGILPSIFPTFPMSTTVYEEVAMEAVSMLVNAALIVGVGLVLNHLSKERFDGLQKQMETQGERLQKQIEAQGDGLQKQIDSQNRRFDDLGRRIDEARAEAQQGLTHLRQETREGLAQVRSEMRDGFAELRSELKVLRSDVTHIALAVGARRDPDTG